MKFSIPEISWHNRDPVLSVDFQPKCECNGPLRLATGGADTHVLIWYLTTVETGSVNLEVAADLNRHQKAVNVVRWSPSGEYLASGDDESIIFIWKQKTDKETAPAMEGEEQYKETWTIFKTLRGHMEDVLDISWSPDSTCLASGSVDNKLILWNVGRGKYSSILSDHKGFVQGVAWDPKEQYIATASSDRVFRTFDIATKKVVSRSSKATLPFPAGHPLHEVKVRLYHDDTLQTYYRRLQFSPDGLLIAVPAGRVEPEQGKLDTKPINAIYIYTRYSLKVPACVLPCAEPALALRWSARLLASRTCGPAPLLAGPRRLLAAATRRAVLLYDTQQRQPLAVVCNMHYTRLTDLSWSPDGNSLVASSTDGFCSVIWFTPGELGDVVELKAVEQTEPMQIEEKEKPPVETEKPTEDVTVKSSPSTRKIDSYIKFKAPEKSHKKMKTTDKQQKTPVKLDVLEETAMPSWSDNSSNEIIKPKDNAMEVDPQPEEKSEVFLIEDSEDIKLVYEDTECNKSLDSSPAAEKTPEDSKSEKSPKDNKSKKSSPEVKQSPTTKSKSPQKSKSPNQTSTPKSTDNSFFKKAKVTDLKEPVATPSVPSPKAPRRVSFVTLSSPKNKKK